jgi:hypothetical protein
LAGCCECGDEPSGSGATVVVRAENIPKFNNQEPALTNNIEVVGEIWERIDSENGCYSFRQLFSLRLVSKMLNRVYTEQ